jgi:hypothetical protein
MGTVLAFTDWAETQGRFSRFHFVERVERRDGYHVTLIE